MTKYKTSQFNYILSNGSDELRLYNSLKGKNSLLIIKNDKIKKFYRIQENCNLDEWEKDEDFLKLKKLGYFVESETDELMLANLKKNDVINYPGLVLTIMPTEDCNFRCQYCYEDHKKGKMSKKVQDSIVKFVRKNINNYTALNIGWFGGEPLEALDVVENISRRLIQVCKVARKPYAAGMTTNGYDLTLDTFIKLLNLKIYEYQITIDGLKSTHDKYRYLKDFSGSFDRIIENIKEISSIKQNRFKVVIRTNFTKDIINNIKEYLEFCEKLFGSDDRFSLSAHLVENWGGESIDKLEDQLVGGNNYGNLIKKILQIKPKISFESHLIDLDSYNAKCYAALRNSYVIGSDGLVYKCTEDFNLPENCIGYLSDEGDLVIDQSKNAKWVDMESLKEEKCSYCVYRGCCLDGPCPKVKILAEKEKGYNSCPRTKHSIHDIMMLINERFYEIL
ncbi:MAG: radical SAM protein [Clostridia bacterium]|nr:radical SAM protein [Clostridia bacterium]